MIRVHVLVFAKTVFKNGYDFAETFQGKNKVTGWKNAVNPILTNTARGRIVTKGTVSQDF